MIIAAARVHHLRHPLRVPAGPGGAVNRHRETLLLRLVAADGTVGWGETYALPGNQMALERLAAELVGRSVFSDPRPVEAPANSFARAAVDIARHDLIGRLTGKPVHGLLGAKVHDRIPAYASGFLYRQGRKPGEDWLREAEQVVDRGFRALKLRIGAAPIGDELAAVDRLRATLGPTFAVAADAWGAYSLPEALEMGRGLAERGLLWFEEPIRPDPGWRGYRRLRDQLGVPIAGGELGASVAEFAGLLDAGAVDVVQPDAAICGGLRAARAVAERARAAGVVCVPHSWNGAVMAAATAHLVATLPPAADGSAPLLEIDTSENRLITELAHPPLKPVDGLIAVTDEPGLGIEVDEDLITELENGLKETT